MLLFFSTYLVAQKTIYQSKSFENLSKDHKIVAIIPFEVVLDLDRTLTKEQLIKLQGKEGFAVQNALETYFLKRHQRKDYRIEFQDINNTNAILLREGMLNQLDIYTTQQLAEVLNVDAIISGNLAAARQALSSVVGQIYLTSDL